jgi:hypothetical protein
MSVELTQRQTNYSENDFTELLQNLNKCFANLMLSEVM